MGATGAQGPPGTGGIGRFWSIDKPVQNEHRRDDNLD